MDDAVRLALVAGATALCAIVGIYYCCVRKLPKTTEVNDQIKTALPPPGP
jgi:hypothetical protein